MNTISLLIASFVAMLSGLLNTMNGLTLFPRNVDRFQQDAFSYIQQWRTSQGKNTYRIDENLCSVAKERLLQLKSDYSHNGFNQMTSTREMYDIRFSKYIRVGENLAEDQVFPDIMLKSWLDSPLHRKNLETDYDDSCLVCDTRYCVHLFGKTKT